MWGLKICQAPARFLPGPPWCWTNENFQGQFLEYQPLRPVCITAVDFGRLKGCCICHCLPENSRVRVTKSPCLHPWMDVLTCLWFFMYISSFISVMVLVSCAWQQNLNAPLHKYLPGITFIWRPHNIYFAPALVAFQSFKVRTCISHSQLVFLRHYPSLRWIFYVAWIWICGKKKMSVLSLWLYQVPQNQFVLVSSGTFVPFDSFLALSCVCLMWYIMKVSAC